MADSDSKLCQRVFQLFCNILGTIVEISRIKFSGLKDDLPEGVFNDRFLLVVVKLRVDDIPGMIINGRRKIGLYHCTVFSYGKLASVLDIALKKHHPVWLAEAFGRTAAGIPVHLHLSYAKAGFIEISFQGGTFQDSRWSPVFLLQNKDDLFHRAFGHLFLQLDCLLYNLGIITGKFFGQTPFAGYRF